jgi:hypothetical protein
LVDRDCHAAVTAGVFLILLDGTMAGICQLQVSTGALSKLGRHSSLRNAAVLGCNSVYLKGHIEGACRMARASVLGAGTIACGALQGI